MVLRKLNRPIIPRSNHFISLLHRWRCRPSLNTSRCFCSDDKTESENLKLFKEKLFKKHSVPDDDAVQSLLRKFPDPKQVVDDLFSPFVKVDKRFAPKIDVKRKFNDKVVKTRLEICWPVLTDVCGIHTDEDTSLQNAYLQACDMISKMGLVEMSENGTHVYTFDGVTKILEDFASKQTYIGKESNNFRILNLLSYDQDALVKWTSSIQVLWPVSFTITSASSSIDLANYQSSLRSLMKLKALGYLDNRNYLKKAVLLGLDQYDSEGQFMKPRNLLEPDYEVFVDASKYGFGAYLISSDNDGIKWLSDSWREDRIKFSPHEDNHLAEFYALVTAIYTWKHKFIGKKVLCYSDNMNAVNIVNHGYYSPRMSRSPKSLSKLFSLLVDVCYGNNITLVADHVNRANNVPADLLSRCDVDAFKKMIPTAHENPKKSKKLWFCNSKEDKPNDDNDDKTPKSKT